MARHRTNRSRQPLVLLTSVLVVLAAVVTLVFALHGRSHDSAASGTTGAQSTSDSVSPSPPTSSSYVPTAPSEPGTLTSASTKIASPTQSAARIPHASTSRTNGGRARGLPLDYSTGDATQVITVVASSTSATTADVQAWSRQGTTWTPYTEAIAGDVGSDGLATHPSESRSATPIGSFTLTQAFGADANPGTDLPYLQTNPSDWWISQPGQLYNTHQRCSADCAFVQGSPNEHLYFETPAYDFAVVINYNTANVGPVVQGAGSAFFLHVSNGTPTAGCVSIPQADLVSVMRWLKPADHPRILIGIGGNNQ